MWLDGQPVPARPCRAEPISLPAGQQELVISPGPAFVADGVQHAEHREKNEHAGGKVTRPRVACFVRESPHSAES